MGVRKPTVYYDIGGPKIKGKTDENRKNCLVYIKRFVGMAF